VVQTNSQSSLRISTKLVTLGGCLYMIYAAGVGSAVTTDFYREIGADELHIALLGGVPMAMLSIFFVGALLANRLPRRKPAFIALFITARLLYVPIAFLPLAFPGLATHVLMGAIIAMIAANCALANFGETLFLSWMADLIPHRILNRFWGTRQRWMSATNVVCYLGMAAFVHLADWPVTVKFPLLVSGAVIVGVIDILLFVRVDEPEHAVVRDRHPVGLLFEPLHHREYRTFLFFECVWRASTVIVGVFATYYLLKVMKVRLEYVILIHSLHVIGPVITGKMWGRLADRHGHRPVMSVCLALKPMYALAYLLVTPDTVLWVLPPVVLVDGMLNGGLGVAENGYSMKMAPRENRSMFFAAVRGLTGICAGAAAIGAGVYLKSLGDWSTDVLGRTWSKYHLVFAASVLMRFVCMLLVRVVREPSSSGTGHVLRDLLPPWPRRWLRAPTGVGDDR